MLNKKKVVTSKLEHITSPSNQCLNRGEKTSYTLYKWGVVGVRESKWNT